MIMPRPPKDLAAQVKAWQRRHFTEFARTAVGIGTPDSKVCKDCPTSFYATGTSIRNRQSIEAHATLIKANPWCCHSQEARFWGYEKL